MAAWFEQMFGVDYGPAAMWIAIAVVAIVAVFAILWIAKRAMSGTFVAGGRSRRPRLAVLDAAAVDSRRRLVLIRRDDVEHLVMIGGPTDVVIEQGIEAAMDAAQTAPTPEAVLGASPEPEVVERPAPRAAEPTRPAPTPEAPAAERVVRPPPPVERVAEATPPAEREAEVLPPVERRRHPESTVASTTAEETARSVGAAERAVAAETGTVVAERSREAAPAGETRPAGQSRTEMPLVPDAASSERRAEPGAPDTAPRTRRAELDSALLKELEATLDRSARRRADNSSDIDDEMAEMIAELGRHRA